MDINKISNYKLTFLILPYLGGCFTGIEKYDGELKTPRCR